MRFEDATIQAQDLFCNPVSLYDVQEVSFFNICSTSFLQVNSELSIQKVDALHFFSFFNKSS